jgi:hypothetical protein
MKMVSSGSCTRFLATMLAPQYKPWATYKIAAAKPKGLSHRQNRG